MITFGNNWVYLLSLITLYNRLYCGRSFDVFLWLVLDYVLLVMYMYVIMYFDVLYKVF